MTLFLDHDKRYCALCATLIQRVLAVEIKDRPVHWTKLDVKTPACTLRRIFPDVLVKAQDVKDSRLTPMVCIDLETMGPMFVYGDQHTLCVLCMTLVDHQAHLVIWASARHWLTNFLDRDMVSCIGPYLTVPFIEYKL
jgi:hypothetical protein